LILAERTSGTTAAQNATTLPPSTKLFVSQRNAPKTLHAVPLAALALINQVVQSTIVILQ